MATIIDELIIRLGLDSKDLTSKGGNATKTLKEIEGQGAKTAQSVQKLGKTSKETSSSVSELSSSFGKLLAVLGGAYAIKAFIQDTIQSSAALDRLSKNLSVSVEDISAWGQAVEATGGSAKSLQSTLSMLSQAQTELRLTGQSALIPYFNQLQIAFAGVDGKARPVNDILLDLAERFSHLDRPTANNLGKMMGIDQDTLNLLLQGRREVEAMISRQKQFNAVSKAQAEESAKLQRSIIGLKQSFTALGRDLLQQAAPALEKVLGGLSSLANWAQNNKEFLGDFMKVIAGGLAAIALATLPFDGVVLAIGAVGTAIALLWQDYSTFQRGGQSLIPWDKWKPGIDAAINAARTLGKVWVTELQAIAAAVVFVQKALNGDWEGAKKGLASSTEKMNKRWGIGGPDEAHDQNASKADALVNKGAQIVKSTVKDVGSHPAGFEVPGQKTLGEAIAQIEGFNAKGKKPNRPQRNHNPGDIEYGDFAKTHGATGSDGRFAIFPDDETGKNALYALLKTPGYAKLTVDQAIAKFAPPNENNTKGYQASVHKMTGLSGSTTVAQALNGIPGASGQAAQAGQPGASTTSNDHSTTLNMHGNTIIHTQATDAQGIARDWLKSFSYQFTAQANSGLS
jgi:hypothetical protein